MPEFLEDLASRLEPLKDVLSRLDNKDKSTSRPASCEDMVSLLRTIDGQPEVEDFAVDGFNAAGPLFMVCVHLLVPMTLMRKREEFAEKARRTPQNAAFKEDPSPRRMRDFILNSITKRRRPTSTGSIWDSIDDEDKRDTVPGASGRTALHGRRRSESRTPSPAYGKRKRLMLLPKNNQNKSHPGGPHMSPARDSAAAHLPAVRRFCRCGICCRGLQPPSGRGHCSPQDLHAYSESQGGSKKAWQEKSCRPTCGFVFFLLL